MYKRQVQIPFGDRTGLPQHIACGILLFPYNEKRFFKHLGVGRPHHHDPAGNPLDHNCLLVLVISLPVCPGPASLYRILQRRWPVFQPAHQRGQIVVGTPFGSRDVGAQEPLHERQDGAAVLGSGGAGAHAVGQQQAGMAGFGDKRPRRVAPVSYTHLDVYKRQHLCRAGAV